MAKLISVVKGRRSVAKHVYYKPNMSNLHGKVGKSIIETIKNTPPAKKDEARRKVEEYKINIIKAREKNEYINQ